MTLVCVAALKQSLQEASTELVGEESLAVDADQGNPHDGYLNDRDLGSCRPDSLQRVGWNQTPVALGQGLRQRPHLELERVELLPSELLHRAEGEEPPRSGEFEGDVHPSTTGLGCSMSVPDAARYGDQSRQDHSLEREERPYESLPNQSRGLVWLANC